MCIIVVLFLSVFTEPTSVYSLVPFVYMWHKSVASCVVINPSWRAVTVCTVFICFLAALTHDAVVAVVFNLLSCCCCRPAWPEIHHESLALWSVAKVLCCTHTQNTHTYSHCSASLVSVRVRLCGFVFFNKVKQKNLFSVSLGHFCTNVEERCGAALKPSALNCFQQVKAWPDQSAWSERNSGPQWGHSQLHRVVATYKDGEETQQTSKEITHFRINTFYPDSWSNSLTSSDFMMNLLSASILAVNSPKSLLVKHFPTSHVPTQWNQFQLELFKMDVWPVRRDLSHSVAFMFDFHRRCCSFDLLFAHKPFLNLADRLFLKHVLRAHHSSPPVWRWRAATTSLTHRQHCS